MVRIEDLNEPDPAIPLLRDLRAGLDEQTFRRRLTFALENGYRLVAARHGSRVQGVAGYHIQHNLFWGKTLYIDDLMVAPSDQGQGIGTQLLSAMKTRAIAEACDHIRLCSSLDRSAAHAFYEANELVPRSLQFVAEL